MKALFAASLLLASSAFAHIKLTAPDSFQITDAYGSPNKAEPCGGAGTATGVVTTVTAGSQLTVSWAEPILHPGHFRIGIATSEADFMTPVPTLSGGGTNCASAPIEANPAYPTIVDGLFVHTTGTGTWTTTVTVPNITCTNCTLQLMQFMSSHGPPCFYYQCAKLNIVQAPVDAGSGGGSGTTGGGSGATGGGTAATGGGTAATGGGTAATGGGTAATGGGTAATGGGTAATGGGTAATGGGTAATGGGSAATGGGSAATGGGSGTTADAGSNPDGGSGDPMQPVGCGCTSGPMAVLLMFPLLLLFRRKA
jgi:hypothetical protein